MSIPETFHFDNSGEVVRYPTLRRFFLTLVVILVALLAFGLGRLSSQNEHSGVQISYEPIEAAPATQTQAKAQPVSTSESTSVANTASVYASSKGTKYYYQNCKSTVSEKNKITFNSSTEAEKAGYTLAANCVRR